MKAFAAIPLALVNGPLVWTGFRAWSIVQETDIVLSMADAMAIGGVASIIPSAFMVWAGMTAKRMSRMHEEHIAKMEPWREVVLQRLQAVETTCSSCDVKQFREEIIQVLHGKTDQYQAALSELELRVISLETEAENA